jgi:hypothetical protein
MTSAKLKKIPTLVGFLLVAILLAVVNMASQALTRLRTDASDANQPLHIKVTNQAETSVTISWVTSSPVTGALVITGDSLIPKTYFDERDISGRQGKFRTHSVSASGLKPDTTYSFSILSNSKTFTNNDPIFRFQTAVQKTPVLSEFDPAYGTVGTTGTTDPVSDAIVYLTLTGAQTLSTLVRDNGSWIIPINLVRTANLLDFISPAERLDSTILIRSGMIESEAITDTLNDSPVPLMIMGKNYDFRKVQANKTNKPFSLLPVVSPNPDQANRSLLGAKTTRSPVNKYKLAITQPKENATLVSNLPMFAGTGTPGTLIQVALGIKSVSTFSVKVGDDGIWRFTPKKTLDPGKQSVTVTGLDSAGHNRAVTLVFDILKSGTQILGEATGSGTISPSQTPTRLSTPSPTARISITPTREDLTEPTPTPANAILPTATPPVTATMTPTLIFISISVALIAAGMILSLF